MRLVKNTRVVLALLVALGPLSGRVAGQDGAGSSSWKNSTELSFVATGGNASSSTVGIKSVLTGSGGPNTMELNLGGVRGETTTRTLTATGTSTDFEVAETTSSRLTAANYFVRSRYDRALGSAFVFGGAGWDRNTFAGVKNRYSLVTGLGTKWFDGESGHLKTDIGATYTIQKDVDPAPGKDNGFGGIRLSLDGARRLSEGATFQSVLISDANVEDSNDLRADWTSSLSVSLASRIAFKSSVQLLIDNLPSLLSIPLVNGAGAATGTNVLTPGEKVDRLMTISLVITL